MNSRSYVLACNFDHNWDRTPYWKVDSGWTNLEDATIFTFKEADALRRRLHRLDCKIEDYEEAFIFDVMNT